jgi:flagellar hook-associated protein 1 FlgK
MYLFDSLHMASNALSTSQLGLQVAGQNFNNADVPGYVREVLQLETGTSRKIGNGNVVGTGVQIAGVVQVLDQFLEERLRTSTSDAMSSLTREKYYTQLESLLKETTDADLSSSLTAFFNSIDNVLNQPENETYRQMTADQGQKLAEDINRLAQNITAMRLDINAEIKMSADEINRLVKEVDSLNKQITLIETKEGRQAIGLRDQRLTALSDLSKLINIKTTESVTGQVSIYCGSDYLLADGTRNEVQVGVKKSSINDVVMSELCIGNSMTPLDVRSGSVAGLYAAHQTVLGNYAVKLDTFAEELVREFNKIYTSGQGLTGYKSLISLAHVDTPDGPISQALLDYPVVNGGFNIQLHNSKTGVTTDHYIEIKVEPPQELDPFSLKTPPQVFGTTMQDIADSISKIDGLSAAVNAHGELEIKAENNNVDFAFASDTSGVLAALGINTFFTGSKAGSIGVNQTVLNDPSKFAASRGGVAADTEIGVALTALSVAKLSSLGNQSLVEHYGGMVSETMLAAGTTKAKAAGDSLYQQSLQSQRDSISGVNIDEETVMMMTYQRMFQANSRLVTIINEMMETLIAM